MICVWDEPAVAPKSNVTCDDKPGFTPTETESYVPPCPNKNGIPNSK